jgi:hypothetical protein
MQAGSDVAYAPGTTGAVAHTSSHRYAMLAVGSGFTQCTVFIMWHVVDPGEVNRIICMIVNRSQHTTELGSFRKITMFTSAQCELHIKWSKCMSCMQTHSEPLHSGTRELQNLLCIISYDLDFSGKIDRCPLTQNRNLFLSFEFVQMPLYKCPCRCCNHTYLRWHFTHCTTHILLHIRSLHAAHDTHTAAYCTCTAFMHSRPLHAYCVHTAFIRAHSATCAL